MLSTTPYNVFSTLSVMPTRARNKFPLFVDRVRFILKEEGINQAELARRCKVARATVTEWMKGRSKFPRADIPFLIEQRLGYSARWVATGEGEPKPKKFDPTDSIIIENLHKLTGHPDRKEEVRAFVDYQVNRPSP